MRKRMVSGGAVGRCRCLPATWVLSLVVLAVGCGGQPEEGQTARASTEAVAPPPAAPGPPPATTDLNAGEAVERSILPDEVHDYRLVLEPGDFIEFEVEQRGIDVELSLLDPDGEVILVMDLPIADVGPESLIAVASQRGAYLARVKASKYEDPEGGYLATLVARRRAEAVDRQRERAAQTFYQGEQASWVRQYRDALAFYDRAVEQWQATGDRFGQALTLDRAGDAWRGLGDLAQATDLHEKAAELFAGLDEPHLTALNANHLGELFFKRGRMEEAFDWHSAALALQRRTDDRRGEGQTLNSLGLIHGIRGETQRALDDFSESLKLLAKPEHRRYRATALHDLGTLYRRLGKPEEAADRFKDAERIYAGLGMTRQQAFSLGRVGQLAFEAGDPERALRILGWALELSRQKGAEPARIATLRRIGSILMERGDPEGARSRYLEALELLAELESPRSEADVLADLGELEQRLGRAEQALEYHRRALSIYERVGDPVREAAGLLGEAVAQRQLGRLEAAREAAARALEISEDLRVKPFSEDLRLSFFTTAQPYFDFNVDLLMDLDELEPDGSHAAAALQVSERARARSLLDLLGESNAEIRGDAAPELLAEEHELQYRLNDSAERMENATRSERQREAAAKEVRQTVSRLHSVRAAIRRKSPRYAALTQPRPLSLDQIQRLLDRDTALLEFRLGERRSHLWLVTRDGLESFALAPGEEIARNARQGHVLLTQARTESAGRTRVLLCALSEQLLGPARGRLRQKRLAIVADGALEYLPFAALPDPDSAADCVDQDPLVAAHEIVHLPSASTLAVLRQEAENRRPPSGTIAVLADPVFTADDPRLTSGPAVALAGQATVALRGADGPGTEAFARLPHTHGEAMAILGLVPEERSYRALGFDASKQAVLSGELEGYRMVHFATHGKLNADEPALSRIVLSQIDRQGRPLEGALLAHEIYNLRLPADLVVLSGCETALGKEVRGEGLLGLARGFMYAGASRVMVSLWKVSDQGTAELMKAFYRGLLRDGLSPAAALRRAQLEVRSRRERPFYWAGFVLQGDWR